MWADALVGGRERREGGQRILGEQNQGMTDTCIGLQEAKGSIPGTYSVSEQHALSICHAPVSPLSISFLIHDCPQLEENWNRNANVRLISLNTYFSS